MVNPAAQTDPERLQASIYNDAYAVIRLLESRDVREMTGSDGELAELAGMFAALAVALALIYGSG